MSANSGHGHAHGHAHAHHEVGKDTDRRLLTSALVLIVGFMAAEVVAGLLASSLALLADAGHLLVDAAALGLALVASRLAARPAKGFFTYGLRRAEILSAQANGLTLLLLTVFFTIEGVRRLVDPPAVRGPLVLATALGGIAVNLSAAGLVSRANRTSLNVEGSYQHLLTDLYAFLATAVAAGVIVTTGWNRADPVATLLVAVLMARAGAGLVGESARVFLEAAPRGIDPAEVEEAMRASAGVVDIHELHVWEVTSGFPALSAHVLVDPAVDCHAGRVTLEDLLATRFHIDHTTLQVDHREEQATVAGGPHAGHPGNLRSTGDHRHRDGCR